MIYIIDYHFETLMAVDKKAANGQLRLILLKGDLAAVCSLRTLTKICFLKRLKLLCVVADAINKHIMIYIIDYHYRRFF